VPGGSISSLLLKFQHFSEQVIQVYTRQLLLGLEYLHRHQIGTPGLMLLALSYCCRQCIETSRARTSWSTTLVSSSWRTSVRARRWRAYGRETRPRAALRARHSTWPQKSSSN
jgi:hypothetical protein